MKKLALLMIVILLSIVGCNSIDGTTLADQDEAKKNEVVDMSGK